MAQSKKTKPPTSESTKKSGNDTLPTPAQLRAIANARKARKGITVAVEHRTHLLQCFTNMLSTNGKPILESDITIQFYDGDDTPTNRRNIQRDMKTPHGGQDLEKPGNLDLRRVKVGHNKLAWTADIEALNDRLNELGGGITRDRALALALARKYLRDVMPPHLMEALEVDFRTADAQLNEVIKRGNSEENLNLLRKRVDMAQRGQRLLKAEVDTDILNDIYSAITTSRCISFDYQAGTPSHKRHSKMSVAGVLLRTPKLYLYGLPEGRENKPENYRQFQINLISNLEIHKQTPSRVNHFDMQSHINDGFTDLLIDFNDREIYEIKIEVTPTGNLIRDLNDFPLSKDQKIKAPKNGKHLLSFPSRRTHQLLEYIVGRGSAFKVIAPAVVVEDVKKALASTLAKY